MTPQEHYDEAERWLALSANIDAPEASWYHDRARAHATLALAGFTRDAATAHTHESLWSGTTTTGRPA